MTPRDRFIRRLVSIAAGLFAAAALLPAAAGAQQPPPGRPAGAALIAKDDYKGIRHHFSFAISGGFDLDVLGDLVNGALGQQGDTQVAIKQSRPWPDIYVTIPKRAELTIGYAVFQKDEVIARLGRATYTSDPLTDAGNYATPAASGNVTLAMTQYREHAWELGWRHHMAMTRHFKQYAGFTYGFRNVDPISMTLSANDTGATFGTFRLYDPSHLKTATLEIGVTLERGRAGLFAEVGGRWQQKLTRQDGDLTPWGFQEVNNSGPRFYMPLQFGVLFRL